MPRLSQVRRRDVHPLAQQVFQMLFGERDPVESPGTATGTPGNWWSVFALVQGRHPLSRGEAPGGTSDGIGGQSPDRACRLGLYRRSRAERRPHSRCHVCPAQEHLSDEEILELTSVTCLYEMQATMCRALRLEYDDVDERIVEFAAPAGAGTDVMSMVDKKSTSEREP